jgi:hypothetical protein
LQPGEESAFGVIPYAGIKEERESAGIKGIIAMARFLLQFRDLRRRINANARCPEKVRSSF